MLNKNQILNNLKDKDDKILFSKIIDQYNFCFRNFETSFTDFMPITKYGEFMKYIKNHHLDVNIKVFGGFGEVERVVIGFFQDYTELQTNDFPISVLDIKYNTKYSKSLTHRDFLGSLIGLGIDRSKLGDIVIKEDGAFCFVSSELADYISINLTKVASSKVSAEICEFSENMINIQNLEEENIIISSLRLDSLVGGAFNISRGKACDFIKAEKVFLNFQVESSVSKEVKIGDIVTLRGSGRIRIDEFIGNTKSDRIVLRIAKYS